MLNNRKQTKQNLNKQESANVFTKRQNPSLLSLLRTVLLCINHRFLKSICIVFVLLHTSTTHACLSAQLAACARRGKPPKPRLLCAVTALAGPALVAAAGLATYGRRHGRRGALAQQRL